VILRVIFRSDVRPRRIWRRPSAAARLTAALRVLTRGSTARPPVRGRSRRARRRRTCPNVTEDVDETMSVRGELAPLLNTSQRAAMSTPASRNTRWSPRPAAVCNAISSRTHACWMSPARCGAG